MVLVHGFASAPRMWRGAESALKSVGFDVVNIAWEPEEGMGIAEAAERVLRPQVETLSTRHHVRLHAIGHSTGGLLLRWLAEQSSEPVEFASLTLLSTPNAGARTGVARIACDSFRQPWRALGCDLIAGSAALEVLGTSVPPASSTRYLAIGVETLPNLLPAPPYDGDGDGVAHSHDNAVMAESAWLEGATFRIWRGKTQRSHFTVACSSTVNDWVVRHLRGEDVPAQEPGRLASEDLCSAVDRSRARGGGVRSP